MNTTLVRRAAALAVAVPLTLLLSGCSHQTVHRAIAATSVDGKPGFSHAVINGNKEDTMVIKVGNGLDKTHGFSIEGYQVKKTVDPGKTVEVKFRLSRAGTFKIYCQLHPAHQTATLIVH